jgi:transcriptional regulator with XRE-family HTH domain
MATRKARGTRLAAARHQAGLSQQALAEKIGTARSTIARIELGELVPSVDLALTISRALGQSVDRLFGGDA